MSNINRKQAFNFLKKSLDNFNFNQKADYCGNEAQTKKFLIDPFFMLLNYGYEDLLREYELGIGGRGSNKADYTIKLNKKDTMLIDIFCCMFEKK